MVNFASSSWEGKGWKYYVKDTVRNRPAMALMVPFYFIFVPVCYYIDKQISESRDLERARFKPKYIVYRDDDPRVKNIIRFDENGNRIYLEPRTT